MGSLSNYREPEIESLHQTGFTCYALEGCGYSKRAVDQLEEFEDKKIVWVERTEKDAFAKNWQDVKFDNKFLNELRNSHQTFPIVFFAGIFIGGADDLDRFLRPMRT